MTLNELAIALRSMPRDAQVMVRLPGGRLAGLAMVGTAHVRDVVGDVTDTAAAADNRFVIVLEVQR